MAGPHLVLNSEQKAWYIPCLFLTRFTSCSIYKHTVVIYMYTNYSLTTEGIMKAEYFVTLLDTVPGSLRINVRRG